jgi:hypothetical protein
MIADPAGFRPELLRDKYWADIIPKQLPYTKALDQLRLKIFAACIRHVLLGLLMIKKDCIPA